MKVILSDLLRKFLWEIIKKYFVIIIPKKVIKISLMSETLKTSNKIFRTTPKGEPKNNNYDKKKNSENFPSHLKQSK